MFNLQEISPEKKLAAGLMNVSRACVSVIIPCYRCNETIGRALASVAEQTLLPKEVILVEDATPDNGATLKEIYKIATKFEGYFEIKVIALNQNQGAANARNIAWNLATGQYVALLDADDAWHPDKIKIQYRFMQENPDVVLCGHDAKIVSDKLKLDWQMNGFSFKYISKIRLLVSNPFVTPSVMMKKDIPFRFDSSKRYVDDHLLWLQIVLNNFTVVKLNLALVAIYKPMYGASGLSSNMWKMEKSELDNYWILYKNRKVDFITVNILSIYSFIKFLRRLFVVALRRIAFVRQ